MSRTTVIELSAFAYKQKRVQQAKGTVHRIEILRAISSEKAVTLMGAGK